MKETIKTVAEMISRTTNVIALTGAGISVESGIPHFRGKGGVWEKIDPMEYAHIGALIKDPVKVWNVLIKETKKYVDRAKPNPAHIGLAKLEKLGILKGIITQNIDGLHQMAGSSGVIEFHGTFAWQRCMNCDIRIKSSEVDMTEIPPKCECGGIYRPDCVFFDEMIPPQHLANSRELSAQCDIMLVIGTSAVVQPASHMPVIAKQNGAKIIEINPEKTPLTEEISDYIIMGKAGCIMPELVVEIESCLHKI